MTSIFPREQRGLRYGSYHGSYNLNDVSTSSFITLVSKLRISLHILDESSCENFFDFNFYSFFQVL